MACEGCRDETVANVYFGLRGSYAGPRIGVVLPVSATYPYLTNLHLRKANIDTNTDAKAYFAANQYQDPYAAHTHPNSTNCHPCSA